VAAILASGAIGFAQETKDVDRQGDLSITLDLRHLERCWRADMRVAAKKAGADSDPFKPVFHVMPAAGACGDPNGPIYDKGRYHLFFQHAPEFVYGNPVSQWAEFEGVHSHTGWGHASSSDLVYWEHEPIALMPEKGSYDPNLCASGSAVLADDGTAMIFYTAAEPQRQCIARSVDPNLRWWRKDPANPIISPGRNQWDHDACYKPFAIFDQEKDPWLLWYNGRSGRTEQIGLAIHPGRDLGFSADRNSGRMKRVEETQTSINQGATL